MTFTAGDGQATLTWSAAAGASSYRIYYSSEGTPAAGSQSYVDGVTGTTYVLKPLSNGIAYSAVVTALNALGESPASGSVSGTPQSAVPPAVRWTRPLNNANTQGINDPVEFAFTQDMDGTTVTASNVTLTGPNGAVSGSVSYSGRMGSFVPGAPLNPSAAYTLTLGTGLKNALGIALAAPVSVAFTTRPAAPTLLVPSPGNGAMTVSFTPAAGASSTRVYLRDASNTTNAPFFACETPGVLCTAFGLNNGTDYEVVARSVVGGIESDPTDLQIATPNGVQYVAAPALVQAHPGNGSVYLEWPYDSSVTGYHLLRATASGGPYVEIAANIAATRWRDTGVTNGQPAYYVVQPEKSGIRGAYSREAAATPSSSRLAAPQPVLTTGNNWVDLQWPAVTGAVGYAVFSSTSRTAAPTVVSYAASTSYHTTYVSNGTGYYLTVMALDASGNEGARSAELLAQPISTGALFGTAPNVRVSSMETARAVVEFSGVDGASTYVVARGTTASGPFSVVNANASSPWTDTTVAAGQTYYYTVQPMNGSQAGVTSAVQPVTVVNATASAPTNVVATGANGTIVLTFTAAPGASYHQVTWSTTPGGPYNSYGPTVYTTNNEINLNGLQNGQTYYLKLTAYFTSQSTSASAAEVSATPSAAGMATPSIAQSAVGQGQVYLGWNAVSGAANYNVYKRNPGSYWTLLTNTSNFSFRDTGLTDGLPNSYAVQAVDTNGVAGAWMVYDLTPSGRPAPQNVQAIAGNGCITYTWDPVPNASGYVVLTGATPNGPYPNYSYSYTVDPAMTLCGLQNSANYRAVVQATMAGYQGAFSAEVSATPSSSRLALPSVTVYSAGDGDAFLSWGAVSGATSYRIYRRIGHDQPSFRIATVTGTSFHDTALINGKTYEYQVQPVGSLASAYSYTAQATPDGIGAPQNVSAVVGDSALSVSWDPIPGASYYFIYSGPPGGPYNNTLAYTRETHSTLLSLQNGAAYTFVVWAQAGQNSSYSPELTATPSSSQLATPNIASPALGDREVVLTWSAIAGATSYRVYRKGDTGRWSALGSTTDLYYRDLGVLNGTKYAYAVQALGSGTTSAWSYDYVNLVPAPSTPAPENLQLIGGSTCITAVWDPVPGADYYNLYLNGRTGTALSASNLYTTETSYTACYGLGSSGVFGMVRAHSAAEGIGVPTGEATTAYNSAPAPTYLSGSVTSPTSVNLSWSTSSAVPQRIWRRDGHNGRYVILGQVPATGSSFSEPNLTTGTNYGWNLQPISASGDGSFYSSELSLTPQ